jgi:hypothetical protein
MLKKITTSLFLLITFASYSQNEVDALRYSLFDNYSTARVSALGGSFSSLGGNIGSVTLNPATLGVYRTDEFSVTFANENEDIKSNYLNNNNNNNRYKLYIQNLSYVKSMPILDNDWNRINISMNYNRTKDLSRKINIDGYNNASSMANSFLQNSQGLSVDDLNGFSDYLAFWTYLIDTTSVNGEYNSSITEIGQRQQLSIDESGSIDAIDFACSGSYKDFLFIGLSLNVTGISFSQHTRYMEDQFNMEINDLESFTYDQYLDVVGSGVNFKMGAIIKPLPSLRLGWAYHSKTYHEIEESYQTEMNTNFINNDSFSGISDMNYFNYELSTPTKTISSIAILFAKKGLLTLDYETIDYSSSNLESYYYSFNQENTNINDFYKKTNNAKIGIEWKYNNIAFRSGYAMYGSPFSNNLNDGSKEYISGGIGFQKGPYFIDIAMINSIGKEDYVLYRDFTIENPEQMASLETIENMIMVSCSYKF